MFERLLEKLDALPVNAIGRAVAMSFHYGEIPIVTSEVASGKTLLLPVYCALEEFDNGPIYVLEPKRTLAINAAEQMWELLGEGGEKLVGVLNSNRADDPSVVHPDNRIIFTTIGYALASGIITNAKCIIFDEAHETGLDLSLAKALVRKRMSEGDSVHVAILSATLDLENEMTFWGESAKHYTTAGTGHPVKYLHRPGWSIPISVSHLIVEEKRTGILVFVEGKEEINETISTIHDNLDGLLMEEGKDYEIYPLHGNSSRAERLAATGPRKAKVKITVATNVAESGVSFPWVDSGVSNGKTKVSYGHGGVGRLIVEELPGWRIVQQSGRTGRFGPGVFILADKKDVHERPDLHEPEIRRLPLTDLVLRCATLGDINVQELQFSPNEQPGKRSLESAIDTLKLHHLIHEEEGLLHLTADGELSAPMPIGFRAMSALCEAAKLKEVGALLPLIAAIEVGDIRFDQRLQAERGPHNYSDWMAMVHQINRMNHVRREENLSFHDATKEWNVNPRKYREFFSVLSILEEQTQCEAKLWAYSSYDDKDVKLLEQLVKQVIFRAMIDARYRYMSFRGTVSPNPLHQNTLFSHESVSVTKSSVCYTRNSLAMFATGNMRVIHPKDGFPFTVLEMVTLFEKKDLGFLAKRFGRDVVDPMKIFFQEEKPVVKNIERVKSVAVEPPVKTRGTLGDLLEAAMAKSK